MKRKQKTMLKKVNGSLTPQYPLHFKGIVDQIEEDEVVQVEFSNPSKSKSKEQLGYLHVAVYPFILATLVDAGYESLYTEKFKNFEVEVKITTDSIDYFFKRMFEVNIQKEFKKRSASKEEMMNYISFIDRWCQEKLGIVLPQPIRK